jgi:hypothetical protein
MPSEKSCYQKKYVKIPLEDDAIHSHWLKKSNEDLLALLISFSEYNFPLRRILVGCAFLEQAQTQQATKLAIDFIFDVRDWIPHDRGGDYSLILDGLKKAIALVFERDTEMAKVACKYACEKAKIVSELLEDNWSWEVGCQELKAMFDGRFSPENH